MTKHTRLYVVRHGQSVLNAKSILAGHVDTPLTELGIKQAHEAKEKLKDVTFDAVYSSDLQRAYETAEIIYGMPVNKANRWTSLRERTYGSLDGKPQAMREERDKAHLSEEEMWDYKHVPGMESDNELAARFMGALEKLARDNLGKTVLVANHGGTIRTMLMKVQGYTHDDFPPGSFKNAGYVVLDYVDGAGFTVVAINGQKTR